MKEYYEEYWARPGTYAKDDPLAATRLSLLWSSIEGVRERPTSLLDAGCGDGDLVADAERRGLTAVGMDISQGAVERARKRYPDCVFHVHPVEDRPWPVSDGAFDVVASFEVIEHLMRPRELIIGARETLRTGGHLALTTPYHGIVKNLLLAVAAFDKHFAVEGDHIRFFSDAALRRLLEREGFAVERTHHFGRGFGLWAGVFVWARKQ